MTSTLSCGHETYVEFEMSQEQTNYVLLMSSSSMIRQNLDALNNQRRYYDASRVERDAQGFADWAHKRALKGMDGAARREILSLLRIGGFACLPSDLVELDKINPKFVTFLLEGRLKEAVEEIPSAGFIDDTGGCDWEFAAVMDVIDTVARLWIAHDLQMEAAAAHVRIFRPTGAAAIDGSYTGQAPIQRSAIKRILEELEIFEEVCRIYFGIARYPYGKCSPVYSQSATATLDTRSYRFALAWPTKTHLVINHHSADADTILVPIGSNLSLRAQLAYIRWLAEHGDELEEYVKDRMLEAASTLKILRTQLMEIANDPSAVRQPVHKQQGVHPLTRLWLACLSATAWTDGLEDVAEEIFDTTRLPIGQALAASRAREVIAEPAQERRNVGRANRLFFALRCAVTRDPQHLPKNFYKANQRATGFGSGRVKGGHADNSDAIAFAEINRFQRRRLGKVKGRTDPKEAYSHDYTAEANKLIARHRKHPTDEFKDIIDQAAGTLRWRLGVRS